MLWLSSAPEFKGDLKDYIEDNIHYPFAALRDNIEGTVFVRLTVDTLGLTQNHVVVKGIRKEVDEEALRVAKMVMFESSAYQNSKKINVEMTLPFAFTPYIKPYQNTIAIR